MMFVCQSYGSIGAILIAVQEVGYNWYKTRSVPDMYRRHRLKLLLVCFSVIHRNDMAVQIWNRAGNRQAEFEIVFDLFYAHTHLSSKHSCMPVCTSLLVTYYFNVTYFCHCPRVPLTLEAQKQCYLLRRGFLARQWNREVIRWPAWPDPDLYRNGTDTLGAIEEL